MLAVNSKNKNAGYYVKRNEYRRVRNLLVLNINSGKSSRSTQGKFKQRLERANGLPIRKNELHLGSVSVMSFTHQNSTRIGNY